MGDIRRSRHPLVMKTRASLPPFVSRVAVATAALILLTVPFASAAEAGITKPFKAKTTVSLSPGITYRVGYMTTTGGRPQQVRVATVDADHPEVQLKALLSNGKVVGREVVTRIALSRSKPGFRPMVATNGDMSLRNRVDAWAAPNSMAVSNGELMVAQGCVRPTLGVDADGSVRIGLVRADISAIPPGRKVPYDIHRVNTHRDDGSAVLFTRRFATSTQTKGGREVVLDLQGKLRPNGTQQVEVLQVRNAGNTALKWGQAVLSVKNPAMKWIYELRVGQTFTLNTQVVKQVNKPCGGIIEAAPGWSAVVEAQGGNHFTLKFGKVAAPSRAKYPSGTQRHPRTGLGVTADGRVFMVTVDGRRSSSVGVTLAEMGQLMKSLGARHAFNLDGGGSTVMARYLKGTNRFAVANRPSDGKQRPATQAFAAFRVDATP